MLFFTFLPPSYKRVKHPQYVHSRTRPSGQSLCDNVKQVLILKLQPSKHSPCWHLSGCAQEDGVGSKMSNLHSSRYLFSSCGRRTRHPTFRNGIRLQVSVGCTKVWSKNWITDLLRECCSNEHWQYITFSYLFPNSIFCKRKLNNRIFPDSNYVCVCVYNLHPSPLRFSYYALLWYQHVIWFLEYNFKSQL